jgi:hypothetical protein
VRSLAHGRRRATALAVVAAATPLLAGCGKGGGHSAVTTVAATTSPVSAPATSAVLEGPPSGAAVVTLTSATVSGADGSAPFVDDAVTDAVLDVIGRYITQAMAVPMTGRTPAVGDVMTMSASVGDGPETDALTDVGIAVAAATPQVTVQTSLVALGVKGAPVSVMVATIDATSRGQTSAGAAIGAHRTGDLTLVLDGGAWKIDSYHLAVERDSP